MSSGELVVDQAGATGQVNELFRHMLLEPGLRMTLGDVATATPERVGQHLGDVDEDCPDQWADKRLISLDDMANNGNHSVVFSGLRTEEAAEHEDWLALGRLLVTNASAHRMRDDVALVSPFVNPHHIDEMAGFGRPGRIIAGGNCMGDIIIPPVAALHRGIGIRSMFIETLQGWSGKGLSEVPKEHEGEIIEMDGDEAIKIGTEPKKMLGVSLQEPADMTITAKPNRGPWVRGHHAAIYATLNETTTLPEVQELLRSFRAPEQLEALRAELQAISRAGHYERWPRKHQPINPIRLRYRDLLRYDTMPLRLTGVHPMRVKAHVRNVDEKGPARIEFEVAGDNLVLGAVGGNLLNIAYARAMGYI